MQDKLTITVDGQEKELFMSYTKLNRLATAVGFVDDITALFVVPETQEKLLGMILVEKGSKKPADIDDLEISADDAAKTIQWIGEHVLDFFLRGLQDAKELGEKNQDRMKSLMPSLAGFESSASETPAAGPTEPTPATSTIFTTESPSET